MKTLFYKTIVLTLFATFLSVFFSCKTSKDTALTKESKELTTPCSNKAKSDEIFFRAANKGQSNNINISRERAILITKQDLAIKIENHFKKVAEVYLVEHKIENKSDFAITIEDFAREVVNEVLIDAEVICEKNIQEHDRSYTTFIAIEVNKNNILEKFNKNIEKKDILNINYDQIKFNKIFEKKMQK